MEEPIIPNVSDKPNYKNLHNKSFKEIVVDANKEIKQELEKPENKIEEVDTTPLEEKVEEVKEKKETKKKVDLVDEVKKTVKETLDEQKRLDKEIKDTEDKAKLDEQKKEKKELKPRWKDNPDYPKNEKGEAIPKSYDEIYEDASNAGFEKAKAWFEEQQAQKDADRERVEIENKQRQETLAKQNEYLNNQIEKDVDFLFGMDLLPKIKDEKNPEDEGIKARDALFATGIKVNQERLAKGEMPISDIKVIYKDYYKKPTNANAQAPVISDGAHTIINDSKLDLPNIRKMSFRDILMGKLKK
jgi:hypothetical protein